LVLVAARRARQIAIEGKEPLVERGTDKPTVIALREIELGLVNADTLEADNVRDKQVQDQAEFASVANILQEQ
jgi:DNA-directed RNA polymerase subunit omega